MNRFSFKLIGSTTAVAILVALAGCGGSSTSVPSVAAPSVPGLGGMSASALKSAGGIYSSLGGSAGVQMLSESFGKKMAINPDVSKFLDAGAIDAVEGGLTNTLAALGGQTLPSGSANLLGALSGKGLDKAALDGMTGALADAGREKNLETAQVSALESMMGSVSQSLLK